MIFILEIYAQDHRELSYFPLGQTRGDSVSQMDGQVTLSEGATLTVNCTYSAITYPTLFWYVQYPGEGPVLLLKATKINDKRTNKGFEATYNAKTTSFHLEKASVQESDSAVYYCALSDTVTETAGGAEHKLSSDGAWMHCGPHRACGCLSLSLWLIQKTYKWLKYKSKKRIFPIPNSLTSKTENSLTPIVPFAGSK